MDPQQSSIPDANRPSGFLKRLSSSVKNVFYDKPASNSTPEPAEEFEGNISTTDTVLSTLNTIVAIVQDISSALSNVPFVGAAAGLVSHIIKAYEEVEANDQACKELIVKVANISQMVFEDLQKVESKDERNQGHLKDFKNDLERYQRILMKIEKALQKATSKRKQDRLKNAIDRSSFSSLLQGYDHELDEFRDLFHTKILIQLVVSSAKLTSDDLQEKIHRWLAPPDPSTNYNLAVERRLKGTGDWLMEHDKYVTWRDVGGSILWLYGIPGSGKTFLCSTAIEDIDRLCRPSPIALARFYFDFKDKDKETPSSLIRSLLDQFALEHPPPTDTLYTRCKNGKRQPTTKEMMASLHETLVHLERSYIIIDALDECSEVEELMTLLADIAQWRLTTVHILVTSRKEVEIEDGLKPLGIIPIDIQRLEVNKDIATYVKTRLWTESGFGKWPKEDVEVIEETLLRGANGMFRWAVCQLDFFRRCVNRADLRKVLKSLPKTLDETYERILSQVGEDHRLYVREALRFLACSKAPATLEAVVEFLAVDLDRQPWPCYDPDVRLSKPDDLLGMCSSLVVHTEPYTNEKGESVPACLQLAHFSVKEYLVSCRGNDTFFHLNETSSHISIARKCLGYRLQFHGNEKRVVTDYTFQSYSAMFWLDHVSAVGGNLPETVMPLILEFLRPDEPHYVNWACYQSYFELSLPPRPLYFVASYGLSTLARILLENGAIVDEGEEDNNYCPLCAASGRGHIDVARLLLQYGADVDCVVGPLIYATLFGQKEEVIRLLLEHCDNVNAFALASRSALQAASIRGRGDISRQLLEYGAEENKDTPLPIACSLGHEDLVKLLSAYGTDQNSARGQICCMVLDALKDNSYEKYENDMDIIRKHQLLEATRRESCGILVVLSKRVRLFALTDSNEPTVYTKLAVH